MIDWIADPLRDTFFVRALAELLLIGVLSGTLGCWVVLRGMSYSAESLAHGMLPGLVLAALTGIPLVVGGAAGLAVAALAIALCAVACPIWVAARASAIRKALVGLVAALVLIAAFQAVALGRAGSPVLFAAPLLLLADAFVRRYRAPSRA